MNERVMKIRVGLMVVSALAITIVLIMLFGAGPKLFSGQYSLYVRFPEASGISVDSPVQKNGVLIGRVVYVKLMDEGGVVLTLKIENRYKLLESETCRIKRNAFLGDAIIEFIQSGKLDTTAHFLADGDFIEDGAVSGDPMQALQVIVNLEKDLSTAIHSIRDAGQEVTILARNLNTAVDNNQGQFQRILQKTELAMEGVHTASLAMDDLIGDPVVKERLKKMLLALPLLFDEARITLADARKTLDGIDRMSSRAEANLENLEKFTKPLGERGDQMVQNIDQSLDNLNSVLVQLAEFSDAMNSKEGTLGRLVHDDEFYQRLNQAASNFEDASRRLRPILDDVRIFTDKIARDPRQLGIKGALDRKPSGIGVKNGGFRDSGTRR